MPKLKSVISTKQFLRDLKKIAKQGKSISKIEKIVDELQKGHSLAPKHRPHQLSGNWKPKLECHIEPDWLLIYEVSEIEVRLGRTGSHSDLF